jgi:3-deoxy-D-manno-octulosonic-acid transferase
VPVVLANARMSEKSARGYARWSGLTRPAFACLAAVCAQSKADAARLAALGATAAEVTGNLKFDAELNTAKHAAGRALRESLGGRKLLLLASTREGEEAMLLDALGTPPAEVIVALVPRHPQRFDEVERLLLARGLRVARLRRAENQGQTTISAGADAPDPLSTAAAELPPYVLGDTMGEMDFYYAAAHVALIGGSFAPLGGQNLIEACAAGVPVVLGPSMFNFAEATRLALEAGAVLQAADAPGAVRAALELLGDPARRRAMGEAGLALCAAHRGATARHLAVCRRLLGVA